jgi:hypothetical protein
MRDWNFAAVLLLLAVARPPAATATPEADWKRVDQILIVPGRDLPDGVRRYGWPRTDLDVRVEGVRIEPPLALTSWASFLTTGDDAMAMGDLVLLGSEVDATVRALQSHGFEILAIHNHLVGETPRLLYVHFHGRGDAAALAQGLREALLRTKTPLASPVLRAKPLSEFEEAASQAIQDVLGRKGSLSGRVLQFGVPRVGKIEDAGVAVPPAMGMATVLNFQMDGGRAAATGDFVLIADEVNPVIRELQAKGITVTALHSHMLSEEPRLFFLHFWGLGTPQAVAEGVRAGLAKVATRP